MNYFDYPDQDETLRKLRTDRMIKVSIGDEPAPYNIAQHLLINALNRSFGRAPPSYLTWHPTTATLHVAAEPFKLLLVFLTIWQMPNDYEQHEDKSDFEDHELWQCHHKILVRAWYLGAELETHEGCRFQDEVMLELLRLMDGAFSDLSLARVAWEHCPIGPRGRALRRLMMEQVFMVAYNRDEENSPPFQFRELQEFEKYPVFLVEFAETKARFDENGGTFAGRLATQEKWGQYMVTEWADLYNKHCLWSWDEDAWE